MFDSEVNAMRTSNPLEIGPIQRTERLHSIVRIASLIIGVLVFIGGSPRQVYSQAQQMSSSLVIHDTTSAANGGEKATEGFRNRFKSALEREKPCVETFDDQDLRDAISDERERELMEGGDGDAALRAIGDKLNSRYVLSVQAMPGPGGTTLYSAFVMDTNTARSIARRMGSEKEVADGLVNDIGPYLADNCRPHWIGTVKWVYQMNETKTTDDEGAAHAARRNVKRKNTQISKIETKITASLIEPAMGADKNSPKARVVHRTIFNVIKSSQTSGEQLCRERGKNPYYKGFSEEYSETVTQVGRATDVTPAKIEIASDGKYTIRIVAPGGTIIGKIDTRESHATCAEPEPTPSINVREFPESKLQSTSFAVEGNTDPKNPTSLTGSKTLPDGRTTITWNLRLVKPKGK